MVSMETTTVMKILISNFGNILKLFKGAKFDKGRKCYQELKFSIFLFLTTLKIVFIKLSFRGLILAFKKFTVVYYIHSLSNNLKCEFSVLVNCIKQMMFILKYV